VTSLSCSAREKEEKVREESEFFFRDFKIQEFLGSKIWHTFSFSAGGGELSKEANGFDVVEGVEVGLAALGLNSLEAESGAGVFFGFSLGFWTRSSSIDSMSSSAALLGFRGG
jgi:hypothetical protein